MEVGPFRLVPNGDGQLKEIDGAWNEYANVLFGASLCMSLRAFGC